MAAADYFRRLLKIFFLTQIASECFANDILGCGGFVKSHVNLDFSKIEIGLYTKEGSLKEKTECAPTNGYYFLPLYEKGEYVLKVHPPAGWSFEPSKVDLVVDGVTDKCSTGQDVNFSFHGFGITGKVITAGQMTGPAGISVHLVNDQGEVRETTTFVGGDFHFTPVIPGKYTLKAAHPRWKLDPAQAVVQVKEGNTVLPAGVLAVKGYDVTGSITSYGNPISGVYVLLYSKEENPKLRVEGCNTALLQGVPDAPICHSVTDASGEFKFGLVPSGEYKLVAMSKSPGQATVTYNVKPASVAFTVRHESLFIRNAFEITGYTVVGSVVRSAGGAGVGGARVSLDGQPAGVTDKAGKYTLPSLQPGTYNVQFQHDECEVSGVQVTVSADGAVQMPTGAVARWRVCGAVSPSHHRTVTITSDNSAFTTKVKVDAENGGKWCTFLPPGVYTAKVDVLEQEQRDGIQFYPVSQKISVHQSAVSDITFSQLKARLSGAVRCQTPALCEGITITIQSLSPDGDYVGKPITTTVKDGAYSAAGVLAGGVQVSAGGRVCWRRSLLRLQVDSPHAAVPDFLQDGYLLPLHASHPVQVEYSSPGDKGTMDVPAGASSQCLKNSAVYTLTPIGCHKYQPPVITVDTRTENLNTVYLTAVSHAVVIRVTSPVPSDDVTLQLLAETAGAAGTAGTADGMRQVGPLTPLERPAGGYVYEHTIYMKENEMVVVSGQSGRLLFVPSSPTQVVGSRECQPRALTLRAHPGLVLAGYIDPPVDGVLVTVVADDESVLTQTTGADGKYRFGPLEASRTYSLRYEKESYVFTWEAGAEAGPGAEAGLTRVSAHRLAQLHVTIVDDAEGTPLQGALVSVSGGQYRRNLVSGESGTLKFSDLSPLQYYVKPLMKEYRFQPPHHILQVEQGKTHEITLRGVRVSWSCVGAVRWVSGRGAAGCTVAALPAQSGLSAEEANSDAQGNFRIRGLMPGVQYTLQLKDCATPELAGTRLATTPPVIQITENKDIENVRLIVIQPNQLTDINVHVYAPNVDHYRHLRLTLASENTPHSHLYSSKLDSAGFSQTLNPGVMYVMPRLPADNNTYVLQLEATLSKATHQYDFVSHYFTSDGRFKSFRIDFVPKMVRAEQELRQTSLVVVPVLALVLALAWRREAVLRALQHLLPPPRVARAARTARQPTDQPDLLDKASIDHILSAVNAAGKRTKKKQ